MQGFAPDSGVWKVASGALAVSAESLGSDAVSVYHVGDALPTYFEVQAAINVTKPTAGWKANSYVIFDYQSATDFKFAGLDVASNKMVMGHRDATGWHVDEQAVFTGGVKHSTTYNILVAVNGLTATLLVNNRPCSPTPSRTRDRRLHLPSTGGRRRRLDNSRGTFDNIAVRRRRYHLRFYGTTATELPIVHQHPKGRLDNKQRPLCEHRRDGHGDRYRGLWPGSQPASGVVSRAPRHAGQWHRWHRVRELPPMTTSS
jgi:hypothetical protein